MYCHICNTHHVIDCEKSYHDFIEDTYYRLIREQNLHACTQLDRDCYLMSILKGLIL